MRIQACTLLLCAAAQVIASHASAQPSAGTRMTPDGKQILISKDVGAERWAISVNLNDGTVTGNVFRTDGSPPQFVWCERTGDDGSYDPVNGNITYSCRGADACVSSPCDSSAWNVLGEVDLPGSFFLPADDPFASLRTPEHFCDDSCHFPEFLAVGEFTYTLDSNYCNYLTVTQETLRPINRGDNIFFRLWHFSLTGPSDEIAYMAIQLGDRVIWDARLPFPCRGGIVGFIPGGDCLDNPAGADADPAEFIADFDAPAGTPVYLHIQNHGDNNYSLVEMSANSLTLIDHDAWRLVSTGLPLLPPSGRVPPKTEETCVPADV